MHGRTVQLSEQGSTAHRARARPDAAAAQPRVVATAAPAAANYYIYIIVAA
jgi:hypothetical protein